MTKHSKSLPEAEPPKAKPATASATATNRAKPATSSSTATNRAKPSDSPRSPTSCTTARSDSRCCSAARSPSWFNPMRACARTPEKATFADADVVLPLRRTPYGMHEIGVREPGGNIVVFASRLA
jgi:hypothetical protein